MGRSSDGPDTGVVNKLAQFNPDNRRRKGILVMLALEVVPNLHIELGNRNHVALHVPRATASFYAGVLAI